MTEATHSEPRMGLLESRPSTSRASLVGPFTGSPCVDRVAGVPCRPYGHRRVPRKDSFVSMSDRLTIVDNEKGHYTQSTKPGCSSCFKCAIVSLSFLCLFLGGFISWALLTKSGQSVFSQKNSGRSSPSFCTPCRRLVLGSAPEDDYSQIFTKQTVTDGGETYDLCCIENGNSEQLDAYIKAKVQGKLREPEIKVVPSVNPLKQKKSVGLKQGPGYRAQLVAHATRKEGDRRVNYEDLQPVTEYSNDFLNKTYLRDIEVDGGRIKINIPGVYDIVSKANFLYREDETAIFVHEISRQNTRNKDGTDTLVKEVLRKKCSRKEFDVGSDPSCHTSVLFGLFHLRRQDEVFVQVTRKDLLDMERQTTFLQIRRVA